MPACTPPLRTTLQGTMLKGRGASLKPDNRFARHSYGEATDPDDEPSNLTHAIEVFPKTIINKVTSPDVPLELSVNPYQGCEHGCSYCYARNSHEYWGYNAGEDFERNILYKSNAAELLEVALRKRNYKPQTIMLSGNTDCYQPLERKLQLTRKLLETLLKFNHPVGIITKNSLITRDLDLLIELAKRSLVHVAISVTTLDEELRSKMEPRTASARKRLDTIQQLTEAGVPVFVMMAPIIPGLNSMEVMDVARETASRGALGIGHQMVRLNGQLGQIFTQWLADNYPDRQEKVLSLIKQSHGGTLNSNEFKIRMKGQGPVAQQIAELVKLAKLKYFAGRDLPAYDYTKFKVPGSQMDLFS